MGQVQRLRVGSILGLLYVCACSSGDDPVAPTPGPTPTVEMAPLPTPPAPAPGLGDEDKPETSTPTDSPADAAAHRERWLHGRLRGHDNSMARMRAVTITETGDGYAVRIANQFGFRCGLEFGPDGRPARMTRCRAGEPGWSASPAVIELECETTERDEICRGSYRLGSGGFRDGARFQLLRRLDRDERAAE